MAQTMTYPLNIPNARTESNWVKATLITVALLFLSAFLFLPLVSVFYEAFRKGWEVYAAAVTDPDAISAIKLTVLAAFISVSGRATWLEGLELLAIYAIAAIAFWYV